MAEAAKEVKYLTDAEIFNGIQTLLMGSRVIVTWRHKEDKGSVKWKGEVVYMKTEMLENGGYVVRSVDVKYSTNQPGMDDNSKRSSYIIFPLPNPNIKYIAITVEDSYAPVGDMRSIEGFVDDHGGHLQPLVIDDWMSFKGYLDTPQNIQMIIIAIYRFLKLSFEIADKSHQVFRCIAVLETYIKFCARLDPDAVFSEDSKEHYDGLLANARYAVMDYKKIPSHLVAREIDAEDCKFARAQNKVLASLPKKKPGFRNQGFKKDNGQGASSSTQQGNGGASASGGGSRR